MGLDNRTYWRGDSQNGGQGFHISLGFPRPGPAVKTLLILNAALFILQMILEQRENPFFLRAWMGMTVSGYWQAWRYLTFQFLHADFGHIFMNMLGLYMIGTSLEQVWGARRFATFYLLCGAAAGAAYVIMGNLLGLPPRMPLIGASGGVCGIVMACAILIPQMRLLFIVFPLSIRTAAMIIFGMMIFSVLGNLLGGPAERLQAMSNIAHLGGALAAAVWLLGPAMLRGRSRPRVEMSDAPDYPRPFATPRESAGRWERKLREQDEEDTEVDRILEKIHTGGVGSLTREEKETLQRATKRQKQEEDRIRRL